MNSANSIDQKTYLFDSRDGLVDIFTGSILLAFGIGMLTGMVWLAGILPALLYPLMQSAKERITAPRLENLPEKGAPVESAQASRNRSSTGGLIALLVGSLVMGILFFVLFASGDYAPQLQAWMRSNFPLAFGGFIGLLLAALALIFRAARFLLYAAVSLTVFVLSQMNLLPLEYAVISIGGLVFLCGWLVMVRFLSTYSPQNRR
jgi:hypothetical protein